MHNIVWSPKAAKEFEKLDRSVQEMISKKLERARIRPHEFFEWHSYLRVHKLRVEDYRILADIYDDKLLILILRAEHRSNVYKKR